MIPTLVTDTGDDARALMRFNANVVTWQQLQSGEVRINGKLVLLSANGAMAKAKELVACGMSQADVKFVDFAEQQVSLQQLAATDAARLRQLIDNPLGVKSDRVRSLPQWGRRAMWTPWEINDPCLSQILRWRPRNFAICVGDYHCGKSTFAQLLAAKLISGETLWSQGVGMSVCAWEDEREDFEERIMAFSGAHAAELVKRTHWFEPENDPERLLDEYIDNLEYLTLHENVRVHVADPWNSFNHDFGGESETRYVQKVLLRLQQVTRKLDCTIILVAHLPKMNNRVRTPLNSFRIGDAAGSKEYGNKVDTGFCIARTDVLAGMLYGKSLTEDDVKGLGLKPAQLSEAQRKIVFGEVTVPEEHLIVYTDKVKKNGMTGRGMGIRGAVRAFAVVDGGGNIVEDPAATFLAQQMW